MNILHLSLSHFRNFANVERLVFPKEPLLVAAAPNATGKTNFLESLVLLLRGRSFRAGTEDCVQWKEQALTVRGGVERSSSQHIIAVQYSRDQRRLRIEEDGAPASLVTFYSRYPLVLFLPEDSFLFARGPGQRRNLMNQILVSSPTYVTGLVQYHRSLRQRNVRLKSAKRFDDVAAWTDLAAEHGASLWHARQRFVEFLTKHLREVYQKLAQEDVDLTVRLTSRVVNKEGLRKSLERSFAVEQRYGFTLHGPHRDDLEVLVGGQRAAVVMSQGQLRLLVISMKLAAHQFITELIGEPPLLLLDEVLSDLDEERQAALLKSLPLGQTLLTCATLPQLLRERSDARLLDLRLILNQSEPEPNSEQKLKRKLATAP
jgi:DNA replication and repair protein RecF